MHFIYTPTFIIEPIKDFPLYMFILIIPHFSTFNVLV